MPSILNLPLEVMLLIFINACFLDGDFWRLSMVCTRFRGISQDYEQLLSREIAIEQLFVAHRVLGFGGRIPSFSNLATLGHWNRQVLHFSNLCNDIRHALGRHRYGTWRAVWFTPLWQQHLIAGLLLYKKLSLSRSSRTRMQELEQLRRPFHTLLRFTSIVASDMLRARRAMMEGESEVRSVQEFWQAKQGPGEKAPWLQQNDFDWRTVEIALFENGCAPVLIAMQLTNAEVLTGRSHHQGGTSARVLRQSIANRLPRRKHYHYRLDQLCAANGVAWGNASFWGNFDPFGLKDSGLSGDEVLREMVKRL